MRRLAPPLLVLCFLAASLAWGEERVPPPEFESGYRMPDTQVPPPRSLALEMLDVGVLVALFDPAHVHHELVHIWLEANRSNGWATCAATENGFARVVAHPAYPGGQTTVGEAFRLLRIFAESGDHHFWPGSTSLRRESRVDTGLLAGYQDVSAAYLLLMAVEHEGCLVTLDADPPPGAVLRARRDQVVTLA